jgi:hypothetical protein
MQEGEGLINAHGQQVLAWDWFANIEHDPTTKPQTRLSWPHIKCSLDSNW